ncbi:hypothetical protein HG537_0F04600 [Torulaspora globosa]|uniref:SWIRM domain-containing protein n=1 Tax=Torulaspora globosa TaxID=48254 RepID=A0A7H9HWP8_9SACH|nr:hypothetical protein HG537_0F04600 [Torulaspora sp. CBS 2947]
MEFYSPQPEHAQLHGGAGVSKHASRLLAMLHREVDDSLDAMLEEKSILSPPPSPETSDDEAEDVGHSKIVVGPVWSAGLDAHRARVVLRNFLAEYRGLGPSGAAVRRRAGLGKSLREPERFYRTRNRRMQGLEKMESDEDEEEEEEDESEVARPSTPARRNRRITAPPCVSPLASAAVLSHGASHYVPSMSWQSLPDYCPPVDTLPNDRCLKVEWKGSPMDLSGDPLRHLLHPAELALAQILRLPCDLYLDSKRRLFLEKTHRLRQGLPFRRTDAQKACKIDVNKASRLYAAFEKVGWLKDSNFTSFL